MAIITNFLFLLSLVILCVQADVCYNNTNCDAKCGLLDYNNDVIALLAIGDSTGYQEYKASANKAIAIMKQYPGVLTNDDDILHMTLQYLCCLSVVEYTKAIEVMGAIKWAPLQIKFGQAVCNYGGDGGANYTSFIVYLDDESQKSVGAFVSQIETALSENGIKVIKPRSQMEPFHSTLGVVDDKYPVQEVLNLINTQIPVFNADPAIIHSFFMVAPFWIFNATS